MRWYFHDRYFQGCGWFIRGIKGLDESMWVERRPDCWHWIITLAEQAILASMFRGLSVPRTDYRAWFMTCRGVVTIARIHGMPSGVYACLRSQSDSWRYLGVRFRIVVVWRNASLRFERHRCFVVFDSCEGWMDSRGGLMHGDVLSYVRSLPSSF